MSEESFRQREHDRAARLLAFVKGEVLNMQIDARLDFVAQLFAYVTPELEDLIRKNKIKPIR